MRGGGFDDAGIGKVLDEGALAIGRDRIAARLLVEIGREADQRFIRIKVDRHELPRDLGRGLPRDLALVALGQGRGVVGGHAGRGGRGRGSRKMEKAHPRPLPRAGGGINATNPPPACGEPTQRLGMGGEPPTTRISLVRRAKPRRKRERAPELMRGKPSGPDGPRPALEGANKKLGEPRGRRSSPPFSSPRESLCSAAPPRCEILAYTPGGRVAAGGYSPLRRLRRR